jgi:chemotaxis protein histidine kinase CheA
MPRSIPITVLALAILFPGGPARAAEPVDYLRSIKPVLAARCYACHGALQQKAKFRLDTVALMKKGGTTGPAIVPGKSAGSLLVAHVTASNGNSRMPPASEGEGLKPAEIAAIIAWIDQGAAGPADEKPETDPKEHWAFKTPVRPPVPKSVLANPIDAFLDAEREKHSLTAAPPADRRLLLRRLYLDLTGLPPTLAAQEAFLKESATKPQAAYEAVVDKLLASPQYGERWGRHWLDVWRYSDCWGLGAEVRNSQKHIWHWRDWVIEALNADKGYDRMAREMLAADELAPTDESAIRATGFLARQYFIFNRNTWLEETVEHTGKAFLGLTLNCAKCHDHKFDPIAQQDFYRFRAFFEPYQVRADMAPGETDFARDGIPRAFDCNLDAPTYLFVRGDEKNPRKDKPLPPGVPAILAFDKLDITPVKLPPDAHSPGLRASVLDNYLRTAEKQVVTARAELVKARAALAAAEKKGPAPIVKDELPTADRPVVRDDFTRENPDLWEMKSGAWKYEGSKLKQTKDGSERAVLRLKVKPPADFQAHFRFVPTGGQMWKSVGLTFDVADGNEALVYLSAVAGGPKLQVSYKQGADYVYPPNGAHARDVKIGEAQDVTVRVRGPLINVAVNGQHALAYRLPVPRKPGALELITFDATAEFSAFELSALPFDVKLVETSAPASAPAAPQTIAQLRLAVTVAEKALAAAELQPAALKARAAAERAKYRQPPAADVKELAKVAARAEKQAAAAAAEEALVRAELADAQKIADSAKKLATAKEALAKAKKDLENPGEGYTPLRGALKTPENNLESEVSRNKPFPAISTGRRSALAKWLTDARNPLTARVAVNHIWARHFGRPLVATVFDFGRKGAPPTHPELLDWLAVEFMEKGWSMKQLHRLIVTSAAYQMTSSAAASPANVAADAENRYYWRMNPVRMEAQVVRDSLLALSGDIDLTLGGPPVPATAEDSRRRSLYFFHSHNEYSKFLSTFDDANVLECYRRAESIVPQQALALENSKLTLAAAARIAQRIDARDAAAFAKAAFATVLGCAPTPAEKAECVAALTEWQEAAVREKRTDGIVRSRANLIHALLNHNDFVTVR